MATSIATAVLFLFICGISNHLKSGRFYQFWSSHVNASRREKENGWAARFFLIIFLISFLAAFLVVVPLIKKFSL